MMVAYNVMYKYVTQIMSDFEIVWEEGTMARNFPSRHRKHIRNQPKPKWIPNALIISNQKIAPNRSSDTNWSWLGGGGGTNLGYGHVLQVKLDNSLYVPFTHASGLSIVLNILQTTVTMESPSPQQTSQRKTPTNPSPIRSFRCVKTIE